MSAPHVPQGRPLIPLHPLPPHPVLGLQRPLQGPRELLSKCSVQLRSQPRREERPSVLQPAIPTQHPAPWTEPIWLKWLQIWDALEASMGVSPTLSASGRSAWGGRENGEKAQPAATEGSVLSPSNWDLLGKGCGEVPPLPSLGAPEPPCPSLHTPWVCFP